MMTIYYPSDHRAYLREELESRKERRPHYSLRAFARDLEMSPSFLCEFLAGRQGMSKERALWVGRRIHLSEEQIQHFWDLIESQFGRSPTDRKAAQTRSSTRLKDDRDRMSVERFRVIADWYHLPILELIEIMECRPTHEASVEIAEVLGLASEIVDVAIDRLIQVGLLQMDQGNYKVTSDYTLTGYEGSNRAIQRNHDGYLRMQADAVYRKSVDVRESLSITLSIPQERWSDFRKELRSSVLNLAMKFGDAGQKKDQVVCLSMQAIALLGKAENEVSRLPEVSENSLREERT